MRFVEWSMEKAPARVCKQRPVTSGTCSACMEFRPDAEDGATLSRRRLLGVGGLVGLASLSGCTRDVVEEFPKNTKWPLSEAKPDLPVLERSDVLKAGVQSMSDADVETVDEFAATLEAEEFQIEVVEELRDVLSVEYVSTVRSGEGAYHDVAVIAGAYAALVENGYDAHALALTIHPAQASSYGSWVAETRLAKRYNAGELTAAEYGELVAKTLETSRTPPKVGVKPDA